MVVPRASAPLPSDVRAETLLRSVPDLSLTAIHLLRPVHAPDSSAIGDFTFVYTNPAGQRMVGFAQPPSGSLLAQFPHVLAAGVFAYYQQAFATEEELPYEANY
jgi:hypothetical protein